MNDFDILAETQHMRAYTCSCRAVHIALPSLTLNLSVERVHELHQLLRQAIGQLDERVVPTPTHLRLVPHEAT